MVHMDWGSAALAKKLIRPYSDRMFAGIVAGNNAGCIWVDREADARSGLVWSEGLECFQFMGCSDNSEFNGETADFVNRTVLDFLRKKGIQYFEYSADTDD